MDWIIVIIAGVVLLSLLVFVHEGGHFLAAKLFKVRVTEFMIGLPGPSIGFTRGGTRYGLTAIPLGGYARVCGMESGEEDPLLADALACVNRHGSMDAEHLACALGIEEDHADELLLTLSGWGSVTTPKGGLVADTYLSCERGGFAKGEAREVADPEHLLAEERKGTYRALPTWRRIVILLAGPAFNLLLAVLIFVVLYSAHGVYEPTNTISSVVDGSPAYEAGLQAGDRIVEISGVQILNWEQLNGQLDSYGEGDEVSIVYERGGNRESTTVQLYSGADDTVALGVTAGYELVHWSVFESLKASLGYIGQVTVAVVGLFMPSTAVETLEQSTSVVGIAYMARDAAGMGVAAFSALGAALSISLGLFNLLPIPPLDGGKILIEVIQRIARRDVPIRLVNGLTMVGIALFLVLFVYLLFQDISRFVIGG